MRAMHAALDVPHLVALAVLLAVMATLLWVLARLLRALARPAAAWWGGASAVHPETGPMSRK